jgi:nitroreductase
MTPAETDESVAELVNQTAPHGGAVTFLFTACIAKEQWRYRHDRALQNLLKKVTTHAQRLLLVGETVGLQSFMSNGVDVPAASDLVGTDRFAEPVVYLVTLGRRAA